MEICIFLIAALIGLVNVFLFAFFLWGFLPSFKARGLSHAEEVHLKSRGVVHFTSKKAADDILRSNVIYSSSWHASYSTHFVKSTFFFINDVIPKHAIRHNLNQGAKTYDTKIVIRNLTDSQLKSFKIRRFDDAVMVEGNFKILEANQLMVADARNIISNISPSKPLKPKDKYDKMMTARLILAMLSFYLPIILSVLFMLFTPVLSVLRGM